MTRTSVRRRRLAGLLSAGLLAALGVGPLGRALAHEPPRMVAAHRYVVRAGDTLWSIAERVAPGADPRATVDSIEAANGLEAGSLVPGRSLVVPDGT